MNKPDQERINYLQKAVVLKLYGKAETQTLTKDLPGEIAEAIDALKEYDGYTIKAVEIAYLLGEYEDTIDIFLEHIHKLNDGHECDGCVMDYLCSTVRKRPTASTERTFGEAKNIDDVMEILSEYITRRRT